MKMDAGAANDGVASGGFPDRTADSDLAQRLDIAIRRAQEWMFSQQHADGYWHAPLEANVGMDAQYIILQRFIGRRSDRVEARLVEHMLAEQAEDGSWPLYRGGSGHLSTTIEAYFALKLAGLSKDHAALQRSREFILAAGGLVRAGVFTRFFLAYFGEFPWYGLPAIPVELLLLPAWFPLNIYAMSSWARETLVPMTVLAAQRPHIELQAGSGVEELWIEPPTPQAVRFPRSRDWLTWRNLFLAVDRALVFLGRSRWKPLRRRALRRAEEWILARQDSNGGWGGIQPPMINCVMALCALGYPVDHPAVAKGIEGVDEFLAEQDGSLFYQPCISPTWDTALAMKGLLDSGCGEDHQALGRAAEWLIDQQIFRPGDWSVYNPKLEPGGWAFEFHNDWYPDVDDTAVILMVLKRIPLTPPARRDRAIAYGLNWALGMQSRNGGWGAFDTDNDAEFLNRIPFADMEAMIDPPTEDLTGRLLELMGVYGYDLRFGRAARGREFLVRTQRPDGSWWGRWGANFIYGTWSALAGLRAIGEDLGAGHVRRAVSWLEQHQNADGGWGETLHSYVDETAAGRGASTPSQTAWAILGLLAGQHCVCPAALAGAVYLLDGQRGDGTWDEDLFTGTGFPGHFYLRYDMYRHYFPLMALGQVRARLESERSGDRGAAEHRLGLAGKFPRWVS